MKTLKNERNILQQNLRLKIMQKSTKLVRKNELTHTRMYIGQTYFGVVALKNTQV